MATGLSTQVGATVSLTKALSGADLALFSLVTDEPPPPADDPAAQVSKQEERTRVPGVLMVALMASAALRHAGGPAAADVVLADVRCTGVAWIGDTLTAAAAVSASDADSGVIRVQAYCANESGERLAEGQFTLHTRGGA